jgi:Amt family ammonium transporter
VLAAAVAYVPYPSWLNPGDNTWQITAATFVGLMSLPGLAVLYASIVPKKWAVNVLAMMFAGFSLVMVAWFIWGYKIGFGANSFGGGVKDGVQTQLGRGGWTQFIDNFAGKPGPVLSPQGEQGQAVSAANTIIPFHFPTASLAYFQLVFAAITPLLFLGSVLGRISGGSSSVPGASSSRCGRPSSTASTPSCCGAVATSPRRDRSTSPVGT